MKKILLFILLCYSINGDSQDSSQIRQIDSLVKIINQSNLKPQYDSIIQNYSQLGLSMKTYLTMVMDGIELKKYVNKVNSTRVEDGVSTLSNSSNIFYFDKNKLIKVEEFIIEGSREGHADWYYSEDKPLYYTSKSENAEDRAALLLTIAKAMLKQLQK